jgi:hypothetical protein
LRRENGSPDRFLILLIFAKLTRRALKHGVFRSVDDLKTAITRFIEQHNTSKAKPFTWRADPDKIIAARNRGVPIVGFRSPSHIPQTRLLWPPDPENGRIGAASRADRPGARNRRYP